MKKKPKASKLKAPPPGPVFMKLSEMPRTKTYCKCQRCRLVFENDVNTMHAPCPKCGAVMENVSLEAATNLKDQWEREANTK